MNRTEFWDLIDEAEGQSRGNKYHQIAIIVSLLKDYAPEEIIEFEKIFCELIIEADTYDVMAAMKIIEGYVTDDPYLYFRCWLISLGRELFTEAVQNPDSLAEYDFFDDVELEELLYVSTIAYQLCTGQAEEDESFPRSMAQEAGLIYDAGAPETKGVDWEEEDLPERLPQLWKKFNEY